MFSEVWGVGCCVCLGGELLFVWFPLPLPKLMSPTVKTLQRDSVFIVHLVKTSVSTWHC